VKISEIQYVQRLPSMEEHLLSARKAEILRLKLSPESADTIYYFYIYVKGIIKTTISRGFLICLILLEKTAIPSKQTGKIHNYWCDILE
jgi:hypothetical protein